MISPDKAVLIENYGCTRCEKFDGHLSRDRVYCDRCEYAYYCCEGCKIADQKKHNATCKKGKHKTIYRSSSEAPLIPNKIKFDKPLSEQLCRTWKRVMTWEEISVLPSEMWGMFNPIVIFNKTIKFSYSPKGMDYLKMRVYPVPGRAISPMIIKSEALEGLPIHYENERGDCLEAHREIISAILELIANSHIMTELTRAFTIAREESLKQVQAKRPAPTPAFTISDETREETEKWEAQHRKDLEVKNRCIICLDSMPNHIILNCAHLCLCESCADPSKVKDCPLCRKPVSSFFKVYPS